MDFEIGSEPMSSSIYHWIFFLNFYSTLPPLISGGHLVQLFGGELQSFIWAPRHAPWYFLSVLSPSCLVHHGMLCWQPRSLSWHLVTKQSSSFLLLFAQSEKMLSNAHFIKISFTYLIMEQTYKQARKLGRCDSYLRNPKTKLTHPLTGVGARRCYRI